MSMQLQFHNTFGMVLILHCQSHRNVTAGSNGGMGKPKKW